jgi:hypothetical protein
MNPPIDWLDALARGLTSELRDHLSDEAVIEDPREGRVSGTEPVHRYLVDAHAWLASIGARPVPVRVSAAGSGAVAEWTVPLAAGGELPIAIALEANDAGLLRSIRVYHSLYPLDRRHRIRPRVLPARVIALAPPVDAYQDALAAGDLGAVLACFEPDGSAREPAGAPWVHRGREALSAFYGALFAGGGIPLEHGSALDDGVACAVEYTVVRWGKAELPPQGGIAVYERGASGLLRAARIYDDVDPPRAS